MKIKAIAVVLCIGVFSLAGFAKQDNGSKPHKPAHDFTAKLNPKDTAKRDTTKAQVKLPPPSQDTTKH